MHLRTINRCLAIVIITINLYFVIAPFYPVVHFWWQRTFSKTAAQLQSVVDQQKTNNTSTTTITRDGRHIVIPKLALDTPVLNEANNTYATAGAWHRARTSTPGHGSNTVIVGHRFTYANPSGVFYHLDKLATGDEILLMWDNKSYIYKVTGSRVVPATETSVEDPTESELLTLYTCTPLWSAKDRLVITAERIGYE